MCTAFIGKRFVVRLTRLSRPLSFLTHPDTEVELVCVGPLVVEENLPVGWVVSYG